MSIQPALLHGWNTDRQTGMVPYRAGRTPTAALVVAILALATGGSKAEAQASDVATYQARVLEVYVDKAIVDINGRRVLVEPIAAGLPFPAAVGSEIQVVGQQRANVLIPRQLILPTGALVESSASGKPPTPDNDRTIEGQLAALGIDVISRPYRRRTYTVVAGRASDGRSVIASFDHNLVLVEVEDA